MEKTRAANYITEVFTQGFERERFRQFVHELLNRYDSSKSQPMQVPDAFIQHIKSCQRLGTYQSPGGELLDILIVHVAEDYKIERTRTALRDFVAHKLKRGDHYKEAALVAFVPPSSKNWRFSYVRMEYETARDPKTGKIKPEERLTPARRYSYLVGVDEKSHTAQKQLLPLLADDKQDPELSAIEQAFSVEKVTKEFFSEYSRLFESTDKALADLVNKDKALKSDFESRHVDTVAFIKKLLGQIVFLYFIQKKGWLGVPKNGKWGDGPRNFLRHLAKKSMQEKKNIFNDVLEPLFYDTLATDRGHEAWCKIFQCRIPFLNGGLFEPLAGYDWENTEINLPNSLFTNQEQSRQGDTGTGILDVFDRYNFTVNEAEPLEKEVAIDPEMLGKVFENLIEENRRKGLGAFYTPREIVHYMCQESLINYLDTGLNRLMEKTPSPLVGEGRGEGKIDRKNLEEWIHQSDQYAHYASAIAAGMLKGDHYPKPPESIRQYAREIDGLLRDILVCDPAIGSGAFPVGMMMEVVRARMALTPYFNDIAERTPYHFKRHAIQSSLYGVDIDVGAVEIAKLRLWLSLVVDEEDVQQIKPLPNLDYKVMQGNSLISEFVGIDFDITATNERKKDSSLFNEEKVKFLKEKQDELQRELIKLHNSEGLTKEKEQALKEQLKKTAKALEAIKKENQPKKETESENFEITNLIKKLDQKKISFQNESNKDKKDLLRNEIENIMVALFKSQLREKYSELKAIDEKGESFPNLKRKEEYLEVERERFSKKYGFDLQKIEEELREFAGEKKIRTFFPWKLYFAEVFHAKGGFDVVIANPPYVRQEKITEFKPALKAAGYECFDGVADLLVYFYERGVKLLRPGGVLTLITSNKFYRAGYGEKLRGFLARELTLNRLIDFGDAPVFEAVAYASILVGMRTTPAPDASTLAYTWEKEMTFERIAQIVPERGQQISQSELKPDGWRLESPAVLRLLEKLRRAGKPLGEYVKGRIYRGIVTGLNEAFVVDRATRDRLIREHKSSAEILKPFLRGRDVKRWRIDPKDLSLIFTRRGVDIKKYPAIYEHLKQFKSKLVKRAGDQQWFELQASPGDTERFEQPKIVIPAIVQSVEYAPDFENHYTNDKTTICVTDDLYYLLGTLNSKVSWWFIRQIAATKQGGFYEFKPMYVSTLPIPVAPIEEQKPVEQLVEQILSAKQRDASADVQGLERKIDRLVYELYGLTKEEIEIVENSK